MLKWRKSADRRNRSSDKGQHGRNRRAATQNTNSGDLGLGKSVLERRIFSPPRGQERQGQTGCDGFVVFDSPKDFQFSTPPAPLRDLCAILSSIPTRMNSHVFADCTQLEFAQDMGNCTDQVKLLGLPNFTNLT